MDDPLVVGALFGTACGAVHAAYVFSERISQRDTGTGTALYYAVWTLALWILFGSYVLYLSMIAIPLFALARAIRWARGPHRIRNSWT
jgi:hypothetical protein